VNRETTCSLLGGFAKLRTVTYLRQVCSSFRPSVCLSLRLSACPYVCLSAWNYLAPAGRIFMKFNIWVFFEKLSRRFKSHSNRTRKPVLCIQINIHFSSYLSKFFLEWKMFQTKVVEEIKTHILLPITFFNNRAVYEIRWKNNVQRCRPYGGWIIKVTNTHSQYVILTAFPLQQWLQGRVSMLLYTYIVCLIWHYDCLSHSLKWLHEIRDRVLVRVQLKVFNASSNSAHSLRIRPLLLGFCQFFWLPDCTGGNHPDDGCFFPCLKPILYNNIIMHLLHSCTHFDLDHSCSILHKSRDTVTWSSFREGDGGTTTKLYGGTLPNRTVATTLKMAAKNLVESRSFLIMWAKPPP